MSCLQYKKNINSQNGEDGIIEYIFNKLQIKDGRFIEFGAWDGKHLSNCRNLANIGWSGIFIESDNEKYKELVKTYQENDKIITLNKMVNYHENDNLDTIIDLLHASYNIQNKEFDFISIDVDGLDYYIFKAMKKHLPKVICIEVNAGHSPTYDKEIPIHIARNNIGQSLQLITEEAKTKGYFPLCYTGNLFLIKNEYKDIFQNDLKNLSELYYDFLSHLNDEESKYLYNLFVISGYYNGFYFVNPELKSFYENRL